MNRVIEKSNVQDIIELNGIQKGLLFHYLKEANENLYNAQLALDIRGRFDPAAFAKALKAVQLRNEALRSVFRWENISTPVQVVLKDCALETAYHDISHLDPDLADGMEQEYLAAERDARFDLAELPLRITLIKRWKDRHVLAVTHHHILYDGWSTGIFLKEVFAAYDQLAAQPKALYKEVLKRSQQKRKDGEWKAYLQGCGNVNSLPPGNGSGVERLHHSFPVKQLDQFCAEHKVTRAAVMYAAYALMVSQYHQNNDIVVGATVSTRDAAVAGSGEVMGNFLNTVPLRVKVGEDLLALVQRVNDGLRSINDLAGSSYFEIKQLLELKQGQELFNTVIAIENYPIDQQLVNGNRDFNISIKNIYEHTSIPLAINVFFREQAAVEFIYNAAKVDAAYVKEFSAAFVAAVNSFFEDKPVQLYASSLNLLNNSAVDYPKDKTIVDIFKEQVAKNPAGIAVQFENKSLTYAELDRLSDNVAAALVQRGITTDVIVGLLTDRSLEMLIGMIGILKAGGAYLPIDVDYPEARIAYFITDSQTPLVLTGRQYADKVSCPVLFFEDVLEADGSVACTATPSSLCYVIYTSGTTGNPKGVMVEHRNVVRLLFNDAFQFSFSSSDVWTMFHSHCFDFSVWEIYGALLYGGKIIIIPKTIAKDSLAYLDILQHEQVTVLNQTPSAFFSLLRQLDHKLSLRYVIFGGEALSPRKLKDWYDKHPHVKLVNMYGITETTVHVTYKEIGAFEIENNISNIGGPIPTLALYLLDEHGRPVPRGVAGELYVGGEGVSRGYLNKPELTAKVFLADPYQVTSRVYKTGDLARILHNGELEYIGRIDHQVQLRGFRIELGEIETQLGKHPQVKEAAVLAKGSDEDKFLVAYYVSNEEITNLRAFLAGRLPEHMVPSFFIRLEQMPLTQNGKLDRKSLPEPEAVAGTEYVAPSTGTEKQLAEIWAEILKTSSISVSKSFFELGGHSLNASTLVNRISRHFEVKVSLREVFIHSDIRSLSAVIDGRKPAPVAGIPASASKPYYKVTSPQKRIYFLNQLNPASLAYNMPFIEKISGPLQRQKLEDSFQKLVDRHEVLRTSFEIIDGQVVQKINGPVKFCLENHESIQQFIRPFDLSKAPLLRAGLVKINEDEHLLMIDIHHIVNDGVSQGVIIKDFVAIYKEEALPPLALQYKDYAEWQQQQPISGLGAFWQKVFEDEVPVLELPTDNARPSFRNDEGAVIDFALTAAQATQLKAVAEKEGCTLFMVLFAAYNVLLHKLASQNDIVVGVPVAGRQHTDAEQMAGLFFNILPMRNKLDASGSFAEFLQSVRKNVLAYSENQAYPYEQLIDDLGIERDVSRNPLFDVLFLFDNFEAGVLPIPGMQVERYSYQHPVSKADLTLSAITGPGTISLRFEYAVSLFREATVKSFAAYFNNIINEIIAGSQRIAMMDILPADERSRLLFQFNQTQGDYDRQATIVSLFNEQAARTPDSICVIFERTQLTYAEVDEQSNQLARQLTTEFNTGNADFVAVLMRRSEKMLISLLAVLKTGAAYLPVDPSYPSDRIKHMLRDSGASVLLTDELAVDTDYEGAVLYFDNPRKSTYSTERVSFDVSAEDTCYLIYTSGSTGLPKGVMISHQNVVNFFAGMNERLNVNENDCMLSVTSIAFDISVLELFWTICHGTQVVIYPSDTSLSNLDRYVKQEERPLDFSLFFFSSYNNEQEDDKYQLLLKSVEYADKQGFKAVWTPERHFHEFGGLYPNPSVVSAALAMITKNIELRSGSVVSPLHDVLRIAEEWAVVDNLSGGRVALSFASGWNPDDFALAPDDYKTRHAKMYAQIEELKRLWKGEALTRVNGLGKEKQLKVFPRPVQAELPVWVTSSGSPDTFKSAGEKGANVLTHFLGQDIKMLSDNIQLYREARINAGHDRGKVTLMLHTYIGDDITEVEATVRAPFIEYLKSSIGLSKVIFEQAGFKEEDLTDELRDKILNNSFRRYYREGALIGTKESCADIITKLKKIGVDEIACLVDFGIEQNKVLDGLMKLKEFKDLHTLQEIKLDKPVTIMQSTPSFINLLMSDEGSADFLASLRTMLAGGEALPLSLLQNIQKRNAGVQVHNMYGPTETTIWSCTAQLSEHITIGQPIVNTQVYILNDHLQPVPAGVAGDLYIGGDGVSKGYWNRPELTAERFIQNPFDQGKIYNTGDIARWLPDGTLEYIGRKDHQVKIRGFRIELGEIEKCLRDIEGVEDAVVIVKEKEAQGKYLAAYIIAGNLTDVAIRNQLAKRLPYYMMPAHIVSLEKFPLTPNGKLDRRALPEPSFSVGREHVQPQTPEEELLAEVWSKVLGVEGIGITENFFSVGGDSIKSIQIISRLRTLGYELTVKDIFTTQNIRELAPRLKSAASSDQSLVSGAFTLTPIQHWFFNGPVKNKHHYNQAVMLRFAEQVSPEIIGAIFTKIQTHHDALRMVFEVNETGVLAETRESLPVFVEVHNQENIEEVCNKIQSSIDLSAGPLMKLGLFQLENESRLLIVIHHLVIDGISWRVLFEDIETLYQQAKAKQPLALPLKTDAFQSWAGRLEQYTASKEFRAGAAYWNKILDKPVKLIPKDANGFNTVSTKKEASFRLDKELTFRLLTQVHQAFGTQINDILLAALLLSTRKLYGNVTATIDMEGHGREEIAPATNYSRTVGWFTSIFPVVLEAESANTEAVVKQVKEALRKIPNRGIDYLLQEKEFSSQIFFNYLGQFDADAAHKSFSIDYESAGSVIAPGEQLQYDWDILAIVTGGQLHVRLTYGDNQYHTATIEQLMHFYHDALAQIIEFCSSRDKVSLTPSDLTYKELPVERVEELQEQYELEDVCSLAPMQEAMRFDTLLEADSPYYFVQISYSITGDMDIATVEHCYQQLVNRYSVLRTVFPEQSYHRPVQVVLTEREADFNYIANGQHDIEYYKAKDRQKKFDLGHDCLLRLTVVKAGDASYYFIWSYHHIVMDGWCVGIIMNDFKEMYAAARNGLQLQLPAPAPFSKYIAWVQERDKEQAMEFWKSYLASYENPAGLPQRRLSPAQETSEQRVSTSVVLNDARVQLLQGLSVKYGVTLNTILQVAWGVMLSKYNHVNDVIFGTVVSGRPSEITGIETMVGLFMNTIPVRIQYSDSDTIGELLQNVQNKAIEAEPYHYGDLSEVESLNPLGRDLFDHLMIFENFPVSETVEGTYVVSKERGEEYAVSGVEMFDQNNYNFYVIIVPGREITVRFDYSPSRYEQAVVENIAERFVNIIDQLAANSVVREVQLATQAERQQILQEFNDTAFDYPGNETIISLFEKQAAQSASLRAVVCNGESISYEALNKRANAVANAIVQKLDSPGIVGLLFEPSIEMIACMLGVLKAGCAYLSLSPATPDERNKYMLADCDAQLLLMQADIFYRKSDAGLINASRIMMPDEDEAEECNGNSPSPKDLMYVIYTSGTTGIPKGVEVEHRGIVNMVSFHQHLYQVQRGTNVNQVANVIFDASAFEIWPCLLQGACLHIAPSTARMDPQLMQQWLIDNNIEFSFQTPVVAQHLLKSEWPSDGKLRIMNIAGDRLNYVPGKKLPFHVFNLYGPTEDSIWTTFTPLPYEGIHEHYSIGKPTGNKQVYIIDKNNHLQPPGIPGEICIAGDGLARGYINDPRLTAEKFIGNPFVQGERLYKTGDLGCWLPDGSIEFLGRVDNQVKIRGFRIELGEIEWQLSSYPGIIETAVVVKTINDEQFLAAYYVAENEIDGESLRIYLRGKLPAYMTPAHFMQLPEMPLTPGGKLDRKALPEPALKATNDFVPASNEVERSVRRIWSEVLELDEELISVNKSFFQLGGHSLKIISMISKVNAHFDVNVSLNDAFEKDNIRDLCDYLITITQHGLQPAGNSYSAEIVL